MRNAELEAEFVRAFIRKERRERILYELGHPKKRRNALSRFCHGAEDLLDLRKCTARGRDLTRSEILLYLQKYGKNAYLMAYDPSLDGMTLPCPAAAEAAFGNGMAAILYIPGIAVVITEQVQGAAETYLLTEKTT